jgi:RHS repeat-associated protein
MNAYSSVRTRCVKLAASALVALLTLSGGLDPPYARASAGPSFAAPSVEQINQFAAERDPALQDPAQQLERLLRDVPLETVAGRLVARVPAGAASELAGSVATLQPGLEGQLATVRGQFEEDRRWLRDNGLAELLPRVDEAQRLAETRHAEVMSLVDDVARSAARDSGASSAALSVLKEKLASFAPPRPAPMTGAEMRAESDLVRAPAPFPDGDAFRRWLESRTETAMAAAAAPQPADLAETAEVTITPRVRAKAVELGGDPLRIYNWVRNNIRYVPGYGAAQSADFTLVNGQGTPFDIASLLIAMLRAAGVPARYATGKIAVPAVQAKSWMEPVEGAADAVEVLQMSGTPSVARVVGGVVEEAQLEHVWVEAWLDYEPSRGAVHREGDSWIPMDASFKQHEVERDLPAVDDQHDIGRRIDAIWQRREQLANGAFTRFDTDAVADELFAFGKEQVPDGMESGTPLPTPRIVPQNVSTFPAALPYTVMTRGATFAEVPDGLRFRVEIEVLRGGGNQLFPVGFSPVFSKTMPLARIGHGGINVEYAPATQAAETALNTLYRQAPSELSPYSIDVAPVIRIGEVIDSILSPVRMGETEQWRVTVRDPFGRRPAEARPFQWTAGTQANISIDAFGLSATAMEDMVPAALQGATVNSRTFLRSAGLGYWYGHDYYASAAGAAFGGRVLRAPSVGAFFKPLTVRYFYGVPRRGTYMGYTTDVLTTVGAWAPTPEKLRNMMFAMGSWGSLLEGLIWDVQSGQQVGTAASSISVLLAANDAGIPIHTIDEDNVDAVMPLLRLSQDSLTEIRNAVNAGMVVVTPQREVSIAGQPAVSGYIIRDPVSGTGLSRIDGSLNGSIVVGCLAEAISLDNLLNYLMWRMIERMLAPLIARGVIAAAAIFALGPIGVIAATAISVVSIICAVMTLLKFLIDMQTVGLEQAICNLLGSCMGKKARRRLFGRGRPIMPEIGMKTLGEVDYEGEGPFPLQFERSYLSGGIGKAPFSAGWSSPYFTEYRESKNAGESFVRVELLPPGSPFTPPSLDVMVGVPHAMLFTLEDGAYFQFNRTPAGYRTVDNHPGRINATGNGDARRWTYFSDDDTEEQYDHQGRLLSRTDRNGVSQTMHYNGRGQLVRVAHSLGRELTFAYHPSGKLASMTAPGSRTTRYEYEGLDLARVIYPDGTNRRYHYEDERFPGKLTGVTDERGVRTVSVEYDYRGRAVMTAGPDGADRYRFEYYEGGFKEIDPLGTIRSYQLSRVQDIWRVTRAEQGCGSCGIDVATAAFDSRGYPSSDTDFEGNVTRYSYDERGLLRSMTEAAGTSLARTKTWEYDPKWRVVTRQVEPVANGVVRVTNRTLDEHGNELQRDVVVGGQTRTWRFSWNAAGQLLSEDGPRADVPDVVSFSYDSRGNLSEAIDALGYVTRYTRYDEQGKLLETVDPSGLVTQYVYDASDRLVETLRGPQATSVREKTAYRYDDSGNLIRTTRPDGSFVHHEYDDAERLKAELDAAGNRISFEYDELGNPTVEQVTDARGALASVSTRSYDQLGRLDRIVGSQAQDVTSFDYDGDGNEVSSTAPLHAQPTRYDYDALGRMAEAVNPEGAVVSYKFDIDDNLSRVVDSRQLGTDYEYNGFGELVRIASPDTGSTRYGYDAAGNRTSHSDARNVAASYSYDRADRLTSVSWPDELVELRYDELQTGGEGARGRLTTAVATPRNGSGLDTTALAFRYDTFGRVVETSQSVGTARALVTTHGFDDQARIESTVLPSGIQVRYGYGSDGRLLSISVNGVEVVRQIEYFPFGEPKAWTYGPDGARYERAFDHDGRVREHSLGTTKRVLTYDLAGRVEAGVDADGAGASWRFDYNEADRVTVARDTATTGPTAGKSYSWTYDSNGNRTTQSVAIGAGASTSTQYEIAPDSNRVTSLRNASTLNRTYDAAGNTTSWTAVTGDFAGSELTASFSGRDRVVRIDRAGPARVARYAYDAFDRRIAKWTGADASIPGAPPTRQFVHDGRGHLVGEYDFNGALIAEHIWLGDAPIATLRRSGSGAAGQAIPGVGASPASEVFFVHPDQLNTPRVVVNAQGQAVWRWESDPFGDVPANEQPTSGLAPFAFSLRMPGQQYDSETGAHHNYYRDYEPGTGRYLSSDPLGLAASLNTYGYVDGEATAGADPLGLVNCRKKGKQPCRKHKDKKPKGTESHHVIQDAAARDLPDYDRNEAPAIPLCKTCHKRTRVPQKMPRKPPGWPEERRVGRDALVAGGMTPRQANEYMKRCVDPYFKPWVNSPDWRQPGDAR